MRPFPPRPISKHNIPIITPLFFGFTRGSDGGSKSLKNNLPKTNLEMIKCLRPASFNAYKRCKFEVRDSTNFKE